MSDRTPRRHRRRVIVVGAVAGLAGVITSKLLSNRGDTEPANETSKLGAAPSTTAAASLEDFWGLVLPHGEDGRPVTLATYRDSGLVLNFWATWCAPCVREFPALDRFSRRPEVFKGWRVLGLAIDQPAAVKAFLTKVPVSFVNAVAGFEGVAWSKAMGNAQGGLPYTVFIRGNKVVARLEGEATDESLLALWRSVER